MCNIYPQFLLRQYQNYNNPYLENSLNPKISFVVCVTYIRNFLYGSTKIIIINFQTQKKNFFSHPCSDEGSKGIFVNICMLSNLNFRL